VSHPLLAKLRDPDPAVRRAACEEAARDPAATLLAGPLAAALGDPEKRVARAASDALVRIGRQGAEEALRAALRAGGSSQRIFAALTAARFEPAGPRLWPALVEALSHADGDVRWAAVRALAEGGRLHSEVLGLLLGIAAQGDSAHARRMAALGLRELAPDLPQAAHALVAASRDPDARVRRAALVAMAALLDPPSVVRERLAAARADDPDPTARQLAGRALEVLAGESPRAR
jgi:HEAT repeat protein